MRRRDVVTLLGGAAAVWPLPARAQQGERVRRIRVLIPLDASDADGLPRVATFQRALQAVGWTEGRNLQIDYRWTGADANRIRADVVEAVAAAPDLIVADGATIVRALQQATRAVPVVFLNVSDPVGAGFVESMAHAGGNLTGFSAFEYAASGKWLELLKEVAPGITRVAILQNPENPNRAPYFRTIEGAAKNLAVEPIATYVRDAAEIERAIDAFARDAHGGLILLPGPFATVHRDAIIALAARHRLPAVSPYRVFATDGGLMSYGVDLLDLYRRSASYVDRVLRGTKPADLPVQQPNKYELVINLKTAKALGLGVPQQLLARADEVIE